jgi:hypothetical protein
MEHNLVIEGHDFKLEIECADFDFIVAIQEYVASIIADSEEEYEIVWEDETEDEIEE